MEGMEKISLETLNRFARVYVKKQTRSILLFMLVFHVKE